MINRIIVVFFLLFSLSAVASEGKWHSIVIEDGHVKVPIIVEGVEAFAIIDTGTTRSALNKAFVKQQQFDRDVLNYAEITGLFASRDRKVFKDVKLNFNNKDYQLNLIEISFGHARNAVLLGADFLSGYVIEIDYPNQRMRLAEREAFNLPVKSNIVMRKQRGSGRLIVNVELNDEDKRWVILDTGHSGGILLEKRVATHNQWFSRYPSKATLVRGVNSMGYHNSLKLPSVGLGNHQLENIAVDIPDNNFINHLTSQYEKFGSRIRGHRVEGLLGYEVLKHFSLLLDYKGGQAYFKR